MNRVLLAAFFLLFTLTACRPPDQAGSSSVPAGVSGRIEVPEAPRAGPATISVHLHDGGEPVSGATVQVTGDMTHAGMVPVHAAAAEVEPGLYRTADFAFSMGGDWFLDAEVTLSSGEQFQLTSAPFSVATP